MAHCCIRRVTRLRGADPFLQELPTRVVFDHMARPDVAKGTNGKDFNLLMKLMETEKFWCKTTCPERLTKVGPEEKLFRCFTVYEKTCGKPPTEFYGAR